MDKVLDAINKISKNCERDRKKYELGIQGKWQLVIMCCSQTVMAFQSCKSGRIYGKI